MCVIAARLRLIAAIFFDADSTLLKLIIADKRKAWKMQDEAR